MKRASLVLCWLASACLLAAGPAGAGPSEHKKSQTAGKRAASVHRAARPAVRDGETEARLRALRERPPAGAIPAQFLQLSPRNKHAIAIDTSRARLYLFENTPTGLKLLSDYYISVGKSGIEKSIEGDLRTPLGVYFVSGNLDPKSLQDFYGAGALPINDPNPRNAKAGGDLSRLLSFYSPDFSGNGKTLAQWTPTLRTELHKAKGREVELRDLSYLRWTDKADTMVVTFGEVFSGARNGPVKRQYWVRQGAQWKIFFEGVIG